MSVGKMTLHRFNGDEIYNIASATIKHYKNEDGSFSVTFHADAGAPPVQTLPDTESLCAKPFAEWTFTLPKIPALALQAGRSFTMLKGYDECTHDYYTNFYYCEHEPMDDNEMVILERDDLRLRVRLIGMTTDVNYYDGSKPRTKVLVEADFTLSYDTITSTVARPPAFKQPPLNMDTQPQPKAKSFSHQAARLSWVCPVILFVLLMFSRQIGAPVIIDLIGLVLILAGLISGIIALFGIPKQGSKGILASAIIGIIINGLLLLVFVTNFMAARARVMQQHSSIEASPIVASAGAAKNTV